MTILYIMPGDNCASTGTSPSLGENEGGERGADGAGQRYEGSGMMNRPGVTGGRLMMATLSVEMRCFIRCGFEGETGGAREQREGSDMR